MIRKNDSGDGECMGGVRDISCRQRGVNRCDARPR